MTSSTINKNYTEIREEWDNWINNYYMPLERYGELGRNEKI
jgi:hypothetical protein